MTFKHFFLVPLLVILLSTLCLSDDKIPTKVLLGLTIDGQGSIVAADPQIEYSYPGIEKILTPEMVKKSVRYLSPLYINHEDLVTKTNPVKLEYDICTTSLQHAFHYALKKYTGETDTHKYELLIAKRVTPDTRPLISVWWFSFIDKDNLPKDERKE